MVMAGEETSASVEARDNQKHWQCLNNLAFGASKQKVAYVSINIFNSLPDSAPGVATILQASLVIGNFNNFCPLLAFDS
jgi:hypothetical protein